MCRNSKNGVKRTVLLFFAFALLVSPCFARASWGGLFGVSEPTVPSAVGLQDSLNLSSPESSEAESAMQSETASQSNYQTLLNQSNELATEYIESINDLAVISNSLENLKTQLETYRATDEISEEAYNTLVELLGTTAEQEAIAEKVNASLSEENQTLETKLAKVKEKVFRPYGKLNVGFGFETLVPTLSTGISLGAKIGDVMVELGANYRIGDIKTFDIGDAFSLERFSATISVGYMF